MSEVQLCTVHSSGEVSRVTDTTRGALGLVWSCRSVRQKARHQQLGHRQEEVVWKTDAVVETCRANFPGGQGRAVLC